ncbi:MAG: 2,3-bisphosphoglycerate-independent phosphoglycerate mutase [Candidatus Stygibacter australis]|nr:2,3-bisphosphoglycerate-independent phosphoglycerate mutase [Candidatus Stygibacter australis]
METKRVLLLILDGFGINKRRRGNAIMAANMPEYCKFLTGNPHNQLIASGTNVGLPAGVMGNSEVGHQNIGAGRVVDQHSLIINRLIENRSFFENKALKSAIEHALKYDSSLHLMGLLSNGHIHSTLDHILPILEMAKSKGLTKVFLHAFMDGRDTLPRMGKKILLKIEKKLKKAGICKIATISGRYYAMDRDSNFERIKAAYNAMVFSNCKHYDSTAEAISDSYNNDVADEFVLPSVINENGQPIAKISDEDSIIFFNYRSDRAKELTRSFVIPGYNDFKVKKFSKLKFVTFSNYGTNLNNYVEVAFPSKHNPNTLAEVINKQKLKQLHLAETQKYAHVTFFFNSGRDKEYSNEKWDIVPSPKVATYDLKPEMSAFEVKDKLVNALSLEKYSFIVTNFANPDMVGHTGDFSATVQALEAVDKCLGEIIPKAREHDYNVILIADHGNADQMLDKNNNVLTQHSTNPVPVIISLIDDSDYQVSSGILADVAPTILKIMDIPIPAVMTGKVLLKI